MPSWIQRFFLGLLFFSSPAVFGQPPPAQAEWKFRTVAYDEAMGCEPFPPGRYDFKLSPKDAGE
jgi:hypothetical protein